MKTNGKTSKTKNALGLDPFADLSGPEWDQPDSKPATTILPPPAEGEQTKKAADTLPTWLNPPKNKKPAAKVETEQVTEQAEAAVDAAESSSEGMRHIMASAPRPQVTDLLGANDDAEVDDDAEFDDDTEFDDDSDLEAFLDDAVIDDDTDLDLTPDNPNPAIQNEYDILDELIASIDEGVEQALSAGTMADLPTKAPGSSGNQKQYVIFTLAGTEYAVPISNVTEIGRPLNITSTPNVPNWVLGVANLRGDIISLVDFRMFLGLETTSFNQAGQMLIAQAHYEDMTTALIVDQVNEIRYLAVDQIAAPTAPIADQVAPYLRGVYEHDEHLLVVLDFNKLLLSSKMQQFQAM